MQCGSGLSQDAQIFQNAAASRRSLLSQLAALPSRSKLPASMLGDLTAAWTASAQADSDYTQWAQDEAAGECVPNGKSDPNYVAAEQPNVAATSDKTAFTSLWNPLARTYGLPTYQQGTL